jgi:hypothetical protein
VLLEDWPVSEFKPEWIIAGWPASWVGRVEASRWPGDEH